MKRESKPKRVSSRVGYQRWASHYDQQDNPMTAMAAHALAAASIDLDGARVIELGCGTGRNVPSVHVLGCESYLGLDNSPEMLAVARSQFAGHPKVRFEQSDLNSDWSSGLRDFDVAIVSLVFEHFERIGELIATIAQVVRQQGFLWCFEIHPQLISAGSGAHVRTESEVLMLPSFQHTAADFVDAFAKGSWQPIATTEWYATDALTEKSEKLARYLGQPVLLELHAQRLA